MSDVLNARVSHMHDIEANWLLTNKFIPKLGEVIVYDKDSDHAYERFKIGDGVTTVNDLPFSVEAGLKEYLSYKENVGYIIDAGRITDYPIQ